MRDPHQAEYTLCEGREENRDIGATAKGYHRLQQQQNRLCRFCEGIRQNRLCNKKEKVTRA